MSKKFKHHEIFTPQTYDLKIWKSKEFTLNSNQVDELMNCIEFGDAAKLISNIEQNNLRSTEILIQLMLLAHKSTIFFHPLIVRKKREPFNQEIENRRQIFLHEIRIIRDYVKQTPMYKYPPKNNIQKRLLVLGIISNEVLNKSIELETGTYIDPVGFGDNNARIYGSGNQRIIERLALNELSIHNADAILDAGSFLLQLNNQLSAYECIRNKNVAKLMLDSLSNKSFTLENLIKTNIQIMHGLGIGGVFRDFDHWSGNVNNPPNVKFISIRMQKWLVDVDSLLKSRLGDYEKKIEIARLAANYNEIHPFREGNGRSLTVETNKIRIALGFLPIFIPIEKNSDYISALGNPNNQHHSENLVRFYDNHSMSLCEFKRLMINISKYNV